MDKYPNSQDRVELSDHPQSEQASGGMPSSITGYLRLYFACAKQYARAYKNKEGNLYTGCCPTCGKQARFPVGPSGTSQRSFTMSCR